MILSQKQQYFFSCKIKNFSPRIESSVYDALFCSAQDFSPMPPSHGCQVFVTHFFVSLRSFQLCCRHTAATTADKYQYQLFLLRLELFQICCRHTAVIRPRLSSFGANFFASLRFSTNLPLHSCQVSVPTFFAPLRIIPNMLPSHGRDHSCQVSMTHFLCLLELSQL